MTFGEMAGFIGIGTFFLMAGSIFLSASVFGGYPWPFAALGAFTWSVGGIMVGTAIRHELRRM